MLVLFFLVVSRASACLQGFSPPVYLKYAIKCLTVGLCSGNSGYLRSHMHVHQKPIVNFSYMKCKGDCCH